MYFIVLNTLPFWRSLWGKPGSVGRKGIAHSWHRGGKCHLSEELVRRVSGQILQLKTKLAAVYRAAPEMLWLSLLPFLRCCSWRGDFGSGNFEEEQKNNDDRPGSGDTFRRIRSCMQGRLELEPDLFWPSLWRLAGWSSPKLIRPLSTSPAAPFLWRNKQSASNDCFIQLTSDFAYEVIIIWLT